MREGYTKNLQHDAWMPALYEQKKQGGKSIGDSIVRALLAILNEKDLEAEEHTIRLVTLSHSVGKRLKLTLSEMEQLSLLALLHDIGKIGISRRILQKPGELTSEEWEEMKLHPEIGYRIVKALPELSGVADCVLYHHERWDGKGYPMGLKGEEIPILCRIIAVMDAYDAMINDRVYRKALSRDAALLELRNNAGTQFDPAIAALFLGMPGCKLLWTASPQSETQRTPTLARGDNAEAETL